ncbi:MAG: hemerythrin domain-containing protein [Chitinophagaceae bacterium]|nr:MAG: hemerythrin domain-containing protein [Chitinophagaceae bacterium]
MRRSEHIIELSRDHHVGLLFCWKIRQGINKNIAIDRMVAYVDYFWHQNLKTHFEEEEKYLFVLEGDLKIQKAIDEHVSIEKDINTILNDSVSIDSLNALADSVDQHIRYEERDLFPYLEQTIPPSELEHIGKKIAEIHHKEKDDYSDEFWLKDK